MGRHYRVSKERRRLLYQQQMGRCYYCGRLMATDKAEAGTDLYFTTDHVIAQRYDDRPRIAREVVAACNRCNNLKGHGCLPVFLLRLAATAKHTKAIGAP